MSKHCDHPEAAWGKVNADDPNEEVHCLWCGDIADMAVLVDHLSRTYDHFSYGRISEPMTKPEEVFAVAADCETRRFEEWVKDHATTAASFQGR